MKSTCFHVPGAAAFDNYQRVVNFNLKGLPQVAPWRRFRPDIKKNSFTEVVVTYWNMLPREKVTLMTLEICSKHSESMILTNPLAHDPLVSAGGNSLLLSLSFP